MAEFKRCRQPQCRTKLAAPVTNRNHAFHAGGCHEGFYAKRCLVCERKLPANARRRVCNWPGCRPAYQRDPGRYKWSKTATDGSGYQPHRVDAKSAHSTGLKIANSGSRPWHILAGPPLTPNQLRAATVPDGPECQWEGGAYERIEAQNRAALKVVDDADWFTEPDWREVISPDGVRCWVISAATSESSAMTIEEQTRLAGLLKEISDDLSIPDFLRRPGATS